MSNVVIPKTIATPFAKTTGDFQAIYSKPAGSTSATVFVGDANSAAALSGISKSTAAASLKGGILHVNLGAGAAARSAAGLAAEATHPGAILTHG
ncbi:MAG: hypothetical protein ABSC05_18905 [Candidatus Solibacter sp.]|jgi:hypothetical protein